MRPAKSETNPIRVLVLDDEKFDRHRLARLCSALPMASTLSNARTLAEFEQHPKTGRFDLVLIDHRLPDGTGLDALKLMRMSQANVHAATIMITGHAQEETAQAALAGGCADYLTKDELSVPAFRRAVGNALDKSRLASQVVAQSYRRTGVEKVLEQFATQCARDIKPMLSRVMRQLRDLRADEGTTTETRKARYEAIEDSCTSMWEFLVALERYQAGQAEPEATVPPAAAVAEPPKRPPTPFARL